MSLMAYGTMLQEFSSEIANEINALINYVHSLAAWEMVLRPLDDKRRLSALVELVDPLATVALNLPYAIRSRFIFATAHLTHQANRLLDPHGWVDDLAADEKIDFSEADRCGGQWKNYKALKRSLERISAKDHQAATRHFRNKYNHRIPPGIGLGLTGMVTRHRDPKTGQTRYDFGFTRPLSIEEIVRQLSQQCVLCYKAFEKFKTLIVEHQVLIQANSRQP